MGLAGENYPAPTTLDPLTLLLQTPDPCPHTGQGPSLTQAGWGRGDGLTTSVGKWAAPGWGQRYCERPSLLSPPLSNGWTVEGAPRDRAPPRADGSIRGSRLAWDPFPRSPSPPKRAPPAPCLLLGFSAASTEPEHKEAEQSVHRRTDKHAQSEAGRRRRTDAGGSSPALSANAPKIRHSPGCSKGNRGTGRERRPRRKATPAALGPCSNRWDAA